jgi:hypothetical protein
MLSHLRSCERYDEPETLPSSICLICPTSADGGHEPIITVRRSPAGMAVGMPRARIVHVEIYDVVHGFFEQCGRAYTQPPKKKLSALDGHADRGGGRRFASYRQPRAAVGSA